MLAIFPFFYWHILQKICNNLIVKYPITPQLRRYTTLWNIKFKKSPWLDAQTSYETIFSLIFIFKLNKV